MGAIQSSVQKCLVVLRVNDTSRCFPCLSPFVHAITKYNSVPIQSEDDIKKMAAQHHLDLEILDLINATTKSLSVSTPLGIGVKFCVPRLLELKVLEVEKGSPAERKIVEGDFVIGIENFYFETNDEFFYVIYRNRGSMLNFIVYRDGQVRRVPIKLNTCEPFLGAVLGEGILMTAGKSGDVINIGTQTECQSDSSRTLSGDADGTQYHAERVVGSKLQHERDVEKAAVGDSNVEPDGDKNRQAESMEEQTENDNTKNKQQYGTGKNSLEAVSKKKNDVEYGTERENLFTDANIRQDEASCSEGVRRETTIEEPRYSDHVVTTCQNEICENICSETENTESSNTFSMQQSSVPTEYTDCQNDAAKGIDEVSDHAHVGDEASTQVPHCQAASADNAHSLDNTETEPEGNINNTCPIIGEYSNEDKIRLLETLTGTKNENMSEPG